MSIKSLCGISHTLSTPVKFIYLFIYLFICPREQGVCHVVSTWRVDWVPLRVTKVECFCGVAISVITITGCCFLGNFDLFLRFGGSLRP